MVAALLESRGALQSLRRTLPRDGPRVLACRTPTAILRALDRHLVDAIVLAPRGVVLTDLPAIRRRYPGIPVVAYAAFRPDDGELLLLCRREGIGAVAVEGLDDGVVGEIVRRHAASAVFRAELADAPRALRLSDPLQLEVWEILLDRIGPPLRTEALAERLGMSREHLSRQFAAGGAPNLKRVIDLTWVARAAQLLRNPAYGVAQVAGLLGFASPAHLRVTTRRIAGVSVGELARLGPRGVLAGFVPGNTRSRLG